MEEINVYPGTSNNMLLIILGLIMTVGSLFIAVIGHKIQTHDIRPIIIGLGSGYAVILIREMRNRNKCPKMKMYSSFKREIRTFITDV
jgi:predicted RND superfamily exporter protein